jgi:hypothetical protein
VHRRVLVARQEAERLGEVITEGSATVVTTDRRRRADESAD